MHLSQQDGSPDNKEEICGRIVAIRFPHEIEACFDFVLHNNRCVVGKIRKYRRVPDEKSVCPPLFPSKQQGYGCHHRWGNDENSK